VRIPPDEFLLVAPGPPVRSSRRPVVENAPIGRPGEAPSMSVRIARLAIVGPVLTRSREDAGINPGAARGGSIGLQFSKAANQPLVGNGVAVDLLQDFLDARLAQAA